MSDAFYQITLLANACWFGAGFWYFAIKREAAAKLLIPRSARSSPRLTSKRMDAGELRLFVLPGHLTTDLEARKEFLEQMRRDRSVWRQALIYLTTIQALAGEETRVVEVRLPASTGY